MFRSIMVPLDGSEFSEQALALAVPVARRSAARLHLVHVRTSLIGAIRPTAGDRIDPEESSLQSVLERVSEELGESVSSAMLGGDVGVLYSTRPRKDIAHALREYAAEHDIDLVVMTTHGRGGLSRFWLGSVADSLVRQLTMPILLVRPRPTPVERPRKPIAHIDHVLIPIDGSRRSEGMIEYAVEVGKLSSARYTLLRAVLPAWAIDHFVLPSVPHFEKVTLEERTLEAEENLGAVAERMRAGGLVVGTTVVTATSAANVIDDFARAHSVDLIAIATQGLGGGSRLLLGSTADKVVRASECPVLVLNTGAAGAEIEVHTPRP